MRKFGFEALRGRGLLEYDDETLDAVEVFLDIARAGEESLGEVEERYRDYLLLSAGEVAVSEVTALDPRQPIVWAPPIRVTATSAWLAATKCNCGWLTCGRLPESLETANLWDVVLFGGDMTKLANLGFGDAKDLYNGIGDAVAHLMNDYEEARAVLGTSPITGAQVEALGAIWLAKSTCITDDEPEEPIGRYFAEIGVRRSSGGLATT